MASTDTNGPLDGLIVADFSRVLAGPYCSMMLGDLGATVIKVESAVGDETRGWMPPARDDRSTYFDSVNRNKRSIVLDLADSLDLARARRLIERSDVVVENFKPGTMARFGLDWASVSPGHPSLVYASLSGFGEDAGASLPGYDLIVQAVSGFMSLTGDADGPAQRAGFAVFDVFAGLHLAVAILAATRHATATGVGQRITSDLLSVALSTMVNQTGAAVLAGVTPWRMGNAHPSIFPYEAFDTADGSVIVAVGNDHQFERLCAELGVRELATRPEFARAAGRNVNRAALRPLLEAAFRAGSSRHWTERMQLAGVPVGEVRDVPGGVALAQELGLDPVVEVDGVPGIRNPVRYAATPASYRLPPPALGADTDAVLRWLDDPAAERI